MDFVHGDFVWGAIFAGCAVLDVANVLMEEEITEDKATLIIEAKESDLNDDEILALLNKEFSAELIDRILDIL